MNHDARATRTSGGRGGGNCWEMKSGPLCAWMRLSGNYNRPRNACSTWRLDSDDVAPRAELIECLPTDLHDRNLRIDDTVFFLGTSIKDAGTQPTNFSPADSTT